MRSSGGRMGTGLRWAGLPARKCRGSRAAPGMKVVQLDEDFVRHRQKVGAAPTEEVSVISPDR
jgi:ribosomal protein S16